MTVADPVHLGPGPLLFQEDADPPDVAQRGYQCTLELLSDRHLLQIRGP